jgi:predicted nucleic acid-binding protein
MKVIFDINIVIDILKRREPFYENSNKIFMLAVDEKINGIISTSAITDVYYLTRKQYADTKTAINIIFDILEIIKPVDTLVNDIFYAAELGFQDFEDAVVAAIAIREKAEYIITRNTRDFSQSVIPAITPGDFLARLTESDG